MIQPVAVVFVHGIHVFEEDFHVPMQKCIEAKLATSVRDAVTFRSVYWAGPVRERQNQYLAAAEARGLFRANTYRRFAVQGLGDAAAYQKTKSHRNSSYYEIQASLRNVLEELDTEGMAHRPLVFIGHSLGCHIISSFAWDINSIKQMSDVKAKEEDDEVRQFVDYLKGGSPFRRLDTLAGLVMMGSNMPLFTFTFGPSRVLPITTSRRPDERPAFPGAQLDQYTRDKVRWLNFYSRNDPLGFPLKPLNEAYDKEGLLTDYEIASEGWLYRGAAAISPALAAYRAHTGYWTHPRVVRETANLISSIATAYEVPKKKRSVFGALRRT